MTALQRIKLNRAMRTHNIDISDTDMLMYYKAYTKIYLNWSDIVDMMNRATLSWVFPKMKKHSKNLIKLLQIYAKSDIIFCIEIAKTYGADVLQLLSEY